MIQGEKWKVLVGNNLDLLPTLEDNSVDSIVTDPPYELGFMGKKWDSTGIAYNSDLWRECLRVLKPGGHLLSFGGTRTWHRIAVAIEDAGFEVRDSIAWMYGSGFPKSLDISKAIDKNNGKPRPTKEFKDFLRAGKAKSGLTSDQIDKALGFTSAVFSPHYVGDNPQIEYPTKEKYAILKSLLGLDDSFDYLIDWAEAEREVIGKKETNLTPYQNIGGQNESGEIQITAPATPEAQQWEGWGTALKPAFEPIIFARKPLIGTVAENVLTYGTGGLNIDGSRIGTGTGEKKIVSYPDIRGDNYQQGKESYSDRGTVEREVVDKGRWPANVILDEYTAGLLDEQSGISSGGKLRTNIARNRNNGIGLGTSDNRQGAANSPDNYGDSGGASRFFYVAKASKRDRNEGLEELENKQALFASDSRLHLNGDGSIRNQDASTKNFHPTVKPTELMRYLVKLVTPPNGLVLDPFTGSGSTGKAAILEGFSFLGMEMTEDYIPIIEGRLRHAETQVKENEGLF